MARLKFNHALPEEPLRIALARLTPGQLFVWDETPNEKPKMRLSEDRYVNLHDGVVCSLRDSETNEVIVCRGHMTWAYEWKEEKRPASK